MLPYPHFPALSSKSFTRGENLFFTLVSFSYISHMHHLLYCNVHGKCAPFFTTTVRLVTPTELNHTHFPCISNVRRKLHSNSSPTTELLLYEIDSCVDASLNITFLTSSNQWLGVIYYPPYSHFLSTPFPFT